MQITVTIDDGLLAQAEALAEPGMTRSELLSECIKAFVQQQAARRLAALGGQLADVELVPRRREDASKA
jgi:metal-responsive CopG/Arc/MetJ family transcriptional regulator